MYRAPGPSAVRGWSPTCPCPRTRPSTRRRGTANRSCAGVEVEVLIGGEDLQMFRPQHVHHLDRRLSRVGDVDRPPVPPRRAGDLAGGEALSWRAISTSTAGASSAEVVTRHAGERGRAPPGRAGRPPPCRPRRLVRDHRHFRRPGQHVYPHFAVQLPFRFRHAAFPRRRSCRLRPSQQPERHRRKGLHAADSEDPLGSGGPGGVQHRGVRPAPQRGRRGRDMLGTPASRATPTVMNALASSGNRPAGR